MNQRVPPHDNEAEQAVLASLMISDCYNEIEGFIESSDFYIKENQTLFETIKKLACAQKGYDLPLVYGYVKEAKLRVDLTYLIELTRIIPNSYNIVKYAARVKEKSLARKALSHINNLSEMLYNPLIPAIEVIDSIDTNLFLLAESTLSAEPKSISLLTAEVFSDIDANKAPNAVTTGFYRLDFMTNGFQPSDLIILAGRPGMGKTAFALNIALNVTKFGKSVCLFSLEMSDKQLVYRLLSSTANINSQMLKKSTLKHSDWDSLTNAGGELSQQKLYIDDTPAIGVFEIRSKLRRLKRKQGLDLAIIDYLQLMTAHKGENREQQIAEISRSLKALAKELNIPIIALSQLNRSVENRSDKRPLPSDLRESGAIEQDADLIIFLYRDEYYNRDSKDKGQAEIIISKHRNGAVGHTMLGFNPEYTQFFNLGGK